ncbi:hypothetical protein TNCV_3866541 [Trichonephila clavipes]|nr:hypothetical protein TNCV_3866541 [Trichonephila clavipes]
MWRQTAVDVRACRFVNGNPSSSDSYHENDNSKSFATIVWICKDLSEGKFDLSTFRSERTNEASTLTITPKRSSSRDVGTSSYRYPTATYPPASVSANRRTNDTIFLASM